MSKFLLYYHTLKYLKFTQIYYRIRQRFYTPKISLKVMDPKLSERKASNVCFIYKDKVYFHDHDEAGFLNHRVNIAARTIWNSKAQEKLWLYNLHYFDALNAADVKQREEALSLLYRWVRENPPTSGCGWAPYPSALRIVNIIKYQLSGGCLNAEIYRSLYIQARYLAKNCEYHLLGNHLFENLKALCFAGLFFTGKEADRWFKKGFNGLLKQVETQLLADGGHFELSPMYHGIILEGLLDLQSLFAMYRRSDLFPWQNAIQNMLNWLWHMMRSERAISRFNDAADGISPEPRQLFDYAAHFGYPTGQKSTLITQLAKSGYIVVAYDRVKAILDIAKVGPDYLPGHAHADTLSFELMIDNFPVFVNLGTSCYGLSERRLFERSTKAHNTVVLNEQNSSEVWAGFRVARRAAAKLINLSDNQKNEALIEAAHDGYTRFKKDLIHCRQWHFDKTKLTMTDRINGTKKAYGYLHLHPHCKVVQRRQQEIMVLLQNGRRIKLSTANRHLIIKNEYAPSFGLLQMTRTIRYEFGGDKRNLAQITIDWS